MIRSICFPAAAATTLLATASLSAGLILLEDFEDAAVGYTSSVPEFSDGGKDFFVRTDGADHHGSVAYLDAQGVYFAAMDIDGEGAAAEQSLIFASLDVSAHLGQTLTLSALFAEDDDGSNEDWDTSDRFEVFARFDGGAETLVMAIRNDGSTFNSAPFLDTNLDGVGDGPEITDSFALHSSAFTATGSTLDLILTFHLDAGEEDLAIDNVRLEGPGSGRAQPVPEPGSWLLGVTGIAAGGLLLRRRR